VRFLHKTLFYQVFRKLSTCPALFKSHQHCAFSTRPRSHVFASKVPCAWYSTHLLEQGRRSNHSTTLVWACHPKTVYRPVQIGAVRRRGALCTHQVANTIPLSKENENRLWKGTQQRYWLVWPSSLFRGGYARPIKALYNHITN